MLRDRGIKKWQGFFMHEHTGLLKKYADEDNKTKKPILDEQELEEINIIIYDSLNYTLPIKIETWRNGYFNIIEGIVDKIDYLNKTITLFTNEEKIKIPIDTITKTERI